MASEDVDCQNCQTNLSNETKDKNKDLQSIFRKLRVNNKPKKITSSRPRLRSTRARSKSCSSLPCKPRRRKILRDPTFVFTGTVSKTAFDGGQVEKTDSVEAKCQKGVVSVERTVSSKTNVCAVQSRIQGCGEQFRNGAKIKVSDSLNMDDTTPDELAAYFDQLLHIPRPMSQMAEMMYT